MNVLLDVSAAVRDALSARAPVVALETSVVAQGLPPPANLEAAARCAAAVERGGAVPAFIAVLGGRLRVGATVVDLERLASHGRVAKAGARDLAALAATRRDAGTTVSATCAVAALAGIRVFATGGIGGVHRVAAGPPSAVRDVSADLLEIARQPVCVVSSGPKAILDVEATAEALETIGVPVIGYRTSELPAFWSAESGIALEHRVEDAAEAARILRVHWRDLGRTEGVLLCVPPPVSIRREQIADTISRALDEAVRGGVGGKRLTPFLLSAIDQATSGESRRANLALLEENARVAAAVAVALAAEA